MFLFNGRYGVASDDNGLYYMRARYYNISIKRFINQDVVTGSIAESQSLNRYAYVEGNPVSYLDPLGLERAFVEYGRTWYPLKSGYFFSDTNYGGKLKVSIDFLNKNTCLTVAQDIIDEGLITGMGKTEIAAEIYFHAVVYYLNLPSYIIEDYFLGGAFKLTDDLFEETKEIDLDHGGEKNSGAKAAYYELWYGIDILTSGKYMIW